MNLWKYLELKSGEIKAMRTSFAHLSPFIKEFGKKIQKKHALVQSICLYSEFSLLQRLKVYENPERIPSNSQA